MKNRLRLNSGFFISWIISFVFMYTISYLWHGVLLNDLRRVTYSLDFFLFLVAVVYFIVAFGLTLLTHLLTQLGKNKIKRGIMIGMPLGMFIYLIAFVFGVSFYTNPSISHILFDLSWQVIEQGLGGVVAGAVLSVSEAVSSRKAF